jgi:hypothetical protein
MNKSGYKLCRVNLHPDEGQIVAELADKLGQTESWVLSTLCASALQSVRDNGLTFPMPLRFEVGESVESAARTRPREAALPKRKAA